MASFVKRWIRRHIGIWPAMEIRNRIVMAPALPRLVAFENREVARLKAQLGQVPTATVACIVPTYRRPEPVVAAIRSILAQDYSDLVVMVVDDGAGLPALPDDPRVFGVSLSHNTGIAGLVRNVGIRLTRSPVLAFLDDDNTWTHDHLTVALAGLEAGAELIYTAVRRRAPDGTEIDVLSRPYDRKLAAEVSFVDTNAVVLRRTGDALFSRLPRTRTTFPREDWEFVYRLSGRMKVAHLPTPTVEYLVNPESYFSRWGEGGDGPAAP